MNNTQAVQKIMCVVSNFDGVISWREFTDRKEAIAWADYMWRGYLVDFYAI